jgi:HSP20 family molecular chaperone IbpA
MSIFNQLIRPFGRAETNGAGQPEFTVKPAYQITQTPEAWSLTTHLPGVTKEGLEVTAEDGQLTIRGRRSWRQPEGWTSLYRESYDAPFELALTHDNTVDAGKIQAELKDGVLRVSLPKAEALKPRKIAVN